MSKRIQPNLVKKFTRSGHTDPSLMILKWFSLILVFKGAYEDRSLEVTGQQMVVITPGPGMFEVDRELATITKQRIVDNGKMI